MKALLYFLMLFAFGSSAVHGQIPWLHPNKGQWENNILYMVELESGRMYIEKDAFTYLFSDFDAHAVHDTLKKVTQYHGLKTTFINSSWKGEAIESDTSSFYRNYFLGKDTTQWKGGVHSFKEVVLKDFYPNIHLMLKASEDGLEYSFILLPNANPKLIQMQHEGEDKIYLDKDGNLIHENSLYYFHETKPKAFITSSSEKNINVEFALNKNVSSFNLSKYNKNDTLVIDPFLVFSSMSGSNSNNFGYAATYDKQQNLYASGIVFGNLYPTTFGAYSMNNAGGPDIGLSKFSSDGASLIYSTFIGGSKEDYPLSMVVADNMQLYLLGNSISSNYPTTFPCFQNKNMGNYLTDEKEFSYDITLTCFKDDGTGLLNSTYYGGEADDGKNFTNLETGFPLEDKSEIVLDDLNNVYIISTTQSAIFMYPTWGLDNSLDGPSDAIVAKFTPNLNLSWATYIGGSGEETGMSLRATEEGAVYITGSTNSTDLPPIYNMSNAYYGGVSDAYVMYIRPYTPSPFTGHYIGGSTINHGYFVDLDKYNMPYFYGLTYDNTGISQGKYGVQGGNHYIVKYEMELTQEIWRTQVGTADHNNTHQLRPTAFAVSGCDDIYYAGWDANMLHPSTNQSLYPTTADAFQATTTKQDVYFAVLGDDGTYLKYASYFGNSSDSSETHTDGGMSRFDEEGRLYHAVCTSCGILNGFQTTPGAFYGSNGTLALGAPPASANGSQCNMAAFKFSVFAINVDLAPLDFNYCMPDSVELYNTTPSGNTYFWDFDDGTYGYDENAYHVYDAMGVWNGFVIVSDSNGCYASDTGYFQAITYVFEPQVYPPTDTLCPGDTIQLQADGAFFFNWTPAQNLDNPILPNPIAVIDSTTHFYVDIANLCGFETLDFTVYVHPDPVSISNDTLLCLGESAELWAVGGTDYLWEPPLSLNLTNNDTVIATPDTTTEYTVHVSTIFGCVQEEYINVEVTPDIPQPQLLDTVYVCENESIELFATGSYEYSWSPSTGLSNTDSSAVISTLTNDQMYVVEFINPCGSKFDSIYVDMQFIVAEALGDTLICVGDSVFLRAQGGNYYQWSSTEEIISPYQANTPSFPQGPASYIVEVSDIHGCTDFDTVYVDFHPIPWVDVNGDQEIFEGEWVNLEAVGSYGNGSFLWTPSGTVHCPTCANTTAAPIEPTTYSVLYTDPNGCRAEASLNAILRPNLYVPNTFTPNGDAFNNTFKVTALNIDEFEILIFNRWGEVIYSSTDVNQGWDGYYNGEICKDGTYTWKITFKGKTTSETQVKTGFVTLLK